MIRALGAVIMLAGATGWGILGALRLRTRVRTLSSFCTALGILQSEICDRGAPLPEILSIIEKSVEKPASLFFRSVGRAVSKLGSCTFSEIWSASVCNMPELMLRENEKTALSALGASLGRYGAKEQGREIEFIMRRFEAFLAEAEKEKARDSRLHTVLGAAAGVFCVIILL